MTWAPDSWRQYPIQQQPIYRDPDAVHRAVEQVRALPPLVAQAEVDLLRRRLAQAARGDAFLLQGGDCAERFEDCALQPIENKLKILMQMSLVLIWGARIPVVRVGRMAGQYAKPRSSDTETIDGVELPTYRGDHVNGHAFDESVRIPDPQRMVQAYFHSAATLNYARALLDGGFADLNHPDHWNLDFVRSPSRRAEYETLMERILDALHFMKATGVNDTGPLRTVQLYTSHEGLLLPYEEAQTLEVRGKYYNLGAHMMWIGDRTRQLDGAHVEYFRGIENPVGVKVGPSMVPSELTDVVNALEPQNRPGRITLITRLGADRVREKLPPLVRAVKAAGQNVVWSCDPMHGNTVKTESGVKTRNVDRILAELRHSFDMHDELGSFFGGVHFELTGSDVTECTGGPQELSEHDLSRSYETFCDPRLNYAQSLEMAFLIGRRLAKRRKGSRSL